MTPALTVVIPAYNEADRLAEGLDRFHHAVAARAVDPATTEILLVDDGSSDGTADEAERLLAALPHHRVLRQSANRGKGAAVRLGIRAARTANVAFLDADMSLNPLGLPALVEALDTAELAIASRTVPGSVVEDATVARIAMSRVFNYLVTAGTGMTIRDTQCGFKGFRTPVARLLFHLVRIDGFAFDVEILRVAGVLGFTTTEVPVHCHNVGGSTVHPLHHARAMLSEVHRSRRGRIPVPPVAALRVQGPGELHQLADRVSDAASGALDGAPMPVVTTTDGAVDLLLPLVTPEAADAAEASVREACGDLTVTRQRLTMSDLVAPGPLAPRLIDCHGHSIAG